MHDGSSQAKRLDIGEARFPAQRSQQPAATPTDLTLRGPELPDGPFARPPEVENLLARRVGAALRRRFEGNAITGWGPL